MTVAEVAAGIATVATGVVTVEAGLTDVEAGIVIVGGLWVSAAVALDLGRLDVAVSFWLCLGWKNFISDAGERLIYIIWGGTVSMYTENLRTFLENDWLMCNSF